MPRAEVTWNGIAKSYRVGGEVFNQNRARLDEWSEDLYAYLKRTRGFTVVDKPVAKKAEPVASKDDEEDIVKSPEHVETSASEVAQTADASSGEDVAERPRGPRSRRNR